MIGTISAINANGTVTAAVNFQKVVKGIVPILNSNIMGDQILDYPALVNVPVFVYQGGGAYIQMPIVVGDTCLLLFCDRDMDIWFETAQVAPPNSDRLHNINDAIALVGINNLPSQFPANTTGLIKVVDATGERLTESGMMTAFAGATAPNGWLLCQGQSISKTTYPYLFAAIGYVYGGSGDNFNVPDMRGNVAVGLKSGDPSFGALGDQVGEETHLLTISEMPAHDHSVGAIISTNPGGSGLNDLFTGSGVNTGLTGGGLAHNNIQPSMVINWIIKI